MSRYFRKFNFNPWGKHIDDCAIRAITGATGLDYRIVCKMLGQKYRDGHGLDHDLGIDLDDIKEKFNSYFDIVEDFNDNVIPPDDILNDPEFDMGLYLTNPEKYNVSGVTLEEWIDMYKGTGNYIVGLVGNPDATNPTAQSEDDGHIICVSAGKNNKPYFIDTWDSSEMYVDSWMRVSRPEPKQSPKHWKYDPQQKKFIL